MEVKMKRPEMEDRELLNRYLSYADTRSCEMVFGNIDVYKRQGLGELESMQSKRKVQQKKCYQVHKGMCIWYDV